MRTFRPNDKVVCIDATPIPAKCGTGSTIRDFVLPGGFVEEGKVYCIESARVRHDLSMGLGLVGKPIIVNGKDVFWNYKRFRLVSPKGHH